MKKWVCVLLLAALVCTLPALAMAATYDVTDLSHFDFSSGKVMLYPQDGDTLTGTGTLDPGKEYLIRVQDGSTLIFDQLNVTGALQIKVEAEGNPNHRVTVKLKGSNRLSQLYFFTSVTFDAEEGAALRLSNTMADDFALGAMGDIVINGGTVEAESRGMGMFSGFGKLILNGGNVKGKGDLAGIMTIGQPEVNGGSLLVESDTAAVVAVPALMSAPVDSVVRLGKSGNIAGWNVNGQVMRPGDSVVTGTECAVHNEVIHFTISNAMKRLSITPITSTAAASSVPQTGDSAPIALWLGLLAASAVGAIILGRKTKKAC